MIKQYPRNSIADECEQLLSDIQDFLSMRNILLLRQRSLLFMYILKLFFSLECVTLCASLIAPWGQIKWFDLN